MKSFIARALIVHLLFGWSLLTEVHAQKKDVYVDKEGVMRWGDTKKEVYGFGINYTSPFAHAYRSAKKLNVDLEKAISDDVYHFSRLGLDAFRVHVWDTEISDSVGNLLENENLRLFDFMLMKMKERGMKLFLTPIAFWGNGWPDRDEKTPGFSHKYGKDACLVNPDAIAAQEKYLFQFLNHVNPYTKVAYKDDPDIVGFEVSNEPHHRGDPEKVIEYINRMVDSMRKTGCKKPMLYNISHGIDLADAYFKSRIDGGTFQWYPTGLGAGHELRGNFLPNVDRYAIPFADHPKFKAMAKIVYEFDAADIGRSYIYPAMARSFREAGIQWATHFAYDPTFLAYANTEYNTHFMNLAYAPQKALSLKIASEVFHVVPLYKNYGSYPDNTKFENFRVSYEEDLAEFVTTKKFLYTNHTKTLPPAPAALEEISGYGNSAVIKYEGRGAYFLDKIGSGVWRLEVLPDAIWVDNLFGQNRLDKTVAVTNWRKWPIEITLPDLGSGFTAKPLKSDLADVVVKGNSLDVRPGVYLLTRKGLTTKWTGTEKWKNITLNEFAAAEKKLSSNYVIHQPLLQLEDGKALRIVATIVTPDEPRSVVVQAYRGTENTKVPMNRISGYDYECTIPAEFIKQGYVSYSILLDHNGEMQTFPSGKKLKPDNRGAWGAESYTTSVVSPGGPLFLFNARTDADQLSRVWRRGSTPIPSPDPDKTELMIRLDKLFVVDSEFTTAAPVYDYTMRYNFIPKISGRREAISHYSRLVLKGRSIEKSFPVQVALIDRQGNAFGGMLNLDTQSGDYAINLSELRPVKLVTMPRPYPTFLPYFFENGKEGKLDLKNAETLQISVGPGLQDHTSSYHFTIESIRLE